MGIAWRFSVKKKHGFTLIELLVVVAIIALLISILLPSLSRAREITKRAVCGSNLRGIGQGMKVYSNDNLDWYPTGPFMPPDGDGNAWDTNVSYVGRMGLRMTTQHFDGMTALAHPSRSMFLLIIDGTCTAKQYICPSSGDNEDDLRNWVSGEWYASQVGVNRFDFRGYPFVSYGIQLPFGNKGKPNENLDPRMVIAAGKGPYFEADQTFQDGRVSERIKGVENAPLVIPGADDEEDILKLDNERWRPYNSRNHSLEGQNCLYQDGHVSFEKRPIVGVNYDNIYTRQDENYTMKDAMLGRLPADEKGPLTNTDSLIIP